MKLENDRPDDWGGQLRFRELYDRHFGMVLVFFRRRGVSVEDSRDLAQDVFLEVYKSLPRIGGEPPKAWIRKIAKHRYCNWLRSRQTIKRGAGLQQTDDYDLDQVVISPRAPGEGPADERLIEMERKLWLQEEMAALPPQMRQCVRLWIVEDLAPKEIASVMQIRVPTVRSHLSQATARLKMTQEEAEEPK